MKPIFTPEDFKNKLDGKVINWETAYADLAAIANAKLEELIESWPVVYGVFQYDEWYYGTEANISVDTHKARLAFVEEVRSEPASNTFVKYVAKT